jgi:sugar lactone lactonase YvrE
VFSLTSGEHTLTIEAHSTEILGLTLAYSPDGTRLATGSPDATAKVWDIITGRELLTLAGHEGPVQTVAFSPDGSLLASGSEDATARIWDLATGETRLTLLGHEERVRGVAFSPDGSRVATSSDDGTAKVWEAATGELLLTLSGHTSAVITVAFNPDGTHLATASRDGTAKLWDAATGQLLLTLAAESAQGLNGVAFSPDGTRLATGSQSEIRIYVLPIDQLVELARSRLTRSFSEEECRIYLHLEACAQTLTLTVAELVGIWREEVGYYWEFKSDGTFGYAESLPDIRGGTYQVTGTYNVEGDLFTFVTDTVCGNRTGVYQLTRRSEEQLTFKKVEEQCAQRTFPFLIRIP